MRLVIAIISKSILARQQAGKSPVMERSLHILNIATMLTKNPHLKVPATASIQSNLQCSCQWFSGPLLSHSTCCPICKHVLRRLESLVNTNKLSFQMLYSGDAKSLDYAETFVKESKYVLKSINSSQSVSSADIFLIVRNLIREWEIWIGWWCKRSGQGFDTYCHGKFDLQFLDFFSEKFPFCVWHKWNKMNLFGT